MSVGMLVITAKSPHYSTETYYKMVLLLLHEYTYQMAKMWTMTT